MAKFVINEPITVFLCPSVNGVQFAKAETRIVVEVEDKGAHIYFLEELDLPNNEGSGEVWMKIRDSDGTLLISYHTNLRMMKDSILHIQQDLTEDQWRASHRIPYVDQSQPINSMLGAGPFASLDPNSREFLQALHAAYAEGLTNFGNFMKGIKEFSMPSTNKGSTDEQRAAAIKEAADTFNTLVQEAAAVGLRTDIDLFPINRVGTQPYSIVRTEVVRIIGVAPEQGKVVDNG